MIVNMRIKKVRIYLITFFMLALPIICWAVEMDSLKTDFLQGNYRRVIFEASGQLQKINIGRTDELNYILGLSYLKEGKFSLARDCFGRILENSGGEFFEQASLGLADTYLTEGRFQEAEKIYDKLIAQDSNSSLKAALLYRLSQLEFKRNNSQQGNLYYSKLKRDFPLSPESRPNKGLGLIREFVKADNQTVEQSSGQYCVQVGFFSSISNASNLKGELLNKNYPAYVERAASGYRVRVGKFKTQKEAADLEEKLSREGFPTKLCP